MIKLARYGAGLLLLAALFYFRLIDIRVLREPLRHPGLLGLAALSCFASLPITALRWHILLRSQGLTLRLWDTNRIVAIGSFFSNLLPGGSGGDLVRGVYIFQASEGRRTHALLSIFIDRLLGLSTFVLSAVAATLLRPFKSYGLFEYGMFGFALLFILAIVVLFVAGHPIAEFVNRIFSGRSHRLALIIDQAGAALREYSRNWRTLLLCMAISLLVVVVTAMSVIFVARATEFGGLSDAEYGIAGIYAMIANAIPFTPGGLGVGEGAFASACIALEPSTVGAAYGTIFLVLRCVIVISTLPGFFAYIFYPHRATLLTPAKAAL